METTQFSCAGNLSLRTPYGQSVSLPNPTVTIRHSQQTIRGCYLESLINSKCYADIDSQQLFNLNPCLKGQSLESDFLPELPIKLTLQLAPTLISQLEHILQSSLTEIIPWLSRLDCSQPNSPFLFTQNWLALSVYQQQKGTQVGYHTFWQVLDLDSRSTMTSKALADAILIFLKSERNLDFSISEDDINEGLELFSTLLDLDHPASASEKAAALSKLQEHWPTNTSLLAEVAQEDGRLMQLVKAFLIQENWTIYTQVDPNSVNLLVKGSTADWMGLVEVDEMQQQVVFYSLLPFYVSRSQCLQVADFFAKANLGLAIGNFELNFDTGRMRYKTSLDVTGSMLDLAMISQIFYTNIATVDQYLESLMRMHYGEQTAATAIRAAEQKFFQSSQ